MINPWVLLGLLIAWIGSMATVGYWQNGVGRESERVVWQAKELAEQKAGSNFKKMYAESESKIAKLLEDKLSGLKANERLVIREIPKIITRDVYRNQCLDADGLQLIERARTGKASTSEPAD